MGQYLLFAAHPLQTSPRFAEYQDRVNVICQGPLLVERYDDKEFVNDLLRKIGGFTMPRAWSIQETPASADELRGLDLPFPIVAKPIRGQGSHGVRVCRDLQDLTDHTRALFKESPAVLLEEFLAGEETTVTIMPPAPALGKDEHWALPIVTHFNHHDGVAPYNGIVAVTENSRAVTDAEGREPYYQEAARECERAARELGVTAPIRIIKSC